MTPSPINQLCGAMHDTEGLFFSALVHSYVNDNRRFLRRGWLADALQEQLQQEGCRFVLLTAEPGAGKSTFMSQLADEHPEWLRYFIRRDQRSMFNDVSATSLLLRIGFQFAALAPELFTEEQLCLYVEQRVGTVAEGGEVVGAKIDRLIASPFCRGVVEIQQYVGAGNGNVVGLRIEEFASGRMLEPEDLLQLALIEPARALQQIDPIRQVVVLVDALDEIRYHRTENNILSWLTNCPSPQLPSNIRFVLSSRRDDAAMRLFCDKQERYLRVLRMEDDARMEADAQTYVSNLVRESALDPALARDPGGTTAFANKAADKAHGNLGYLDALARGLDQAIARNNTDAIASLLSLTSLPTDLEGLYAFFFKQIKQTASSDQIPFRDPETDELRYPDSWLAAYRPVLGVLAVATQPLGPELIRRLGAMQTDLASVLHVLDHMSQFLNCSNGTFRLYHSSLAEFLTDPRTAAKPATASLFHDPKEWHGRIAAHYWLNRGAWSKCGDYGLSSLATHLAESEQTERLMALFDNNWMQARRDQGKGSYHGFLADISVARAHLEARDALTLERRIHLATMAKLPASLISALDDDDLQTLVLFGKEEEAIAHAQLRSSVALQFQSLVRIHRTLSEAGLQDASLLRRAMGLAEAIQNPARRAASLLEIAEVYATADPLVAKQLYDDVERTIPKIEDPQHRWYALRDAIGCLSRTAAFDGAEESLANLRRDVRNVSEWRQDGKFLGGDSVVANAEIGLVEALLKAGQFEEVERLIGAIKDAFARARAWAALSIACSIRADSRAVEYANQSAEVAMRHPYRRDETLGAAGAALLRVQSMRAAGLLDLALQEARKTPELADRATALSRLARTCHTADETLALRLFEEATAVADQDEFEHGRERALGFIALDLSLVGEHTIALHRAALIRTPDKRAELLIKLANRLRETDLRQSALDQAFLAFNMIEDSSQRLAVGRSLALGLAQSRDPRAAAAFQIVRDLSSSPVSGHFDWALAQWAPVFTRSGHVTITTQIVRLIKKSLARRQALDNSLKTAGADDLRTMKALANEFEDEVHSAVVLTNLARYFAKKHSEDASQFFERAEIIGRRLPQHSDRAEALSYLASCLNELGSLRAEELFEAAYEEAVCEQNRAGLFSDEQLMRTAFAFAVARRHPQAMAITEIQGLNGNQLRRDIVANLASRGRLREARAYLLEMDGNSSGSLWASERDWALADVAIRLGNARRFKVAESVATGISHPTPRARAFLELGAALSSVDSARADELFRQSQEAALSNDDSQMIAYICVDLFRAGARNAHEMLDKSLSTIYRGLDSDRTLLNIVEWLCEIGRVNEALGVVRRISKSETREIAHAHLARALAMVGRFEEARSTIDLIEASQLRDFAHGWLATSYANTGRFDDAEAVLTTMIDAGAHAVALCQIGVIAGRDNADRGSPWFAQMRKLIRKVDDEKAIVQLAHRLADDGKYGEAVDVLVSCDLDTYLQTLAEILPFFEEENDRPAVTLQRAATIAGWVRPDWRELCAALEGLATKATIEREREEGL